MRKAFSCSSDVTNNQYFHFLFLPICGYIACSIHWHISELFGNANWPDNITHVFTYDYESTLIILKDCEFVEPCAIDSRSVKYFKWPRDMSRYGLRDGLNKHLVVSSWDAGSFDQGIKTSVAKLFVEAAARFGGGNGYYSFALFERHFDNFYIHTYLNAYSKSNYATWNWFHSIRNFHGRHYSKIIFSMI